MNLQDGAVCNWGGHWQQDTPLTPDFSVIGGRGRRGMNAAEAQRLYDTLGSIEKVAKHLGIGKNKAYSVLRSLDVKMRRVGTWAKYHEKKRNEGYPMKRSTSPTVRVPCPHKCMVEDYKTKAMVVKRCVLHDFPGSCDKCRL